MAEIETGYRKESEVYDMKIPAAERDKSPGNKVIVALRKWAKRHVDTKD